MKKVYIHKDSGDILIIEPVYETVDGYRWVLASVRSENCYGVIVGLQVSELDDFVYIGEL